MSVGDCDFMLLGSPIVVKTQPEGDETRMVLQKIQAKRINVER